MNAEKKIEKKAEKKRQAPVVVLDGPSPEILASAIVDVAASAQKLLSSRLTKRTVIILIKDQTNLAQHQIEAVLDAAANLDRYVKR